VAPALLAANVVSIESVGEIWFVRVNVRQELATVSETLTGAQPGA
jgi:hypothetical protein